VAQFTRGIYTPAHKENESDHDEYKHYYDEESKKIVRDVWGEDLEDWGYTFDGRGVGKRPVGLQIDNITTLNADGKR